MSAVLADALTIAFVGQIDHGKSSLLGRLLHDSGAFPKEKIAHVRKFCEATQRPFEYAFLLDALKDEREQGMTMDYARAFLTVRNRAYHFVDAPGHREFVGGMLTGTSRADAAVIVCDINDLQASGLRRHIALVELLGITDLAVFINKMDTVGYSQARFESACISISQLLDSHRLRARAFIPGSAREGASVVSPSSQLSWYQGPTLLDFAEQVCVSSQILGPFRFMVQDYLEAAPGTVKGRIYLGQVLSGSASLGDRVVFLPGGDEARLSQIADFPPTQAQSVQAGESVALVFEPALNASRGELCVLKTENAPSLCKKFRATLFWFSSEPLKAGRSLAIRTGTQQTWVRVERILATVSPTAQEDRVVSCELSSDEGVLIEAPEGATALNRFVIVEGGNTVGIGRKAPVLSAEASKARSKKSAS